ncbi:hypothetical protein RJ641_004390 [Dillenia turbinata]|uniref:Uncharacterized protein n=1 Tax=Dillenia turbinata TaxID=194707 RepID=A0AAN8VIA0_9MAGN
MKSEKVESETLESPSCFFCLFFACISLLLLQIMKKTLNNAFESVTEDEALKSSKDSIDFSPAPELSDGSQHPDSSASFEAFAHSTLDESTLSSTITSAIEEESNVLEISSFEVDVVVDLRKAQSELLNLRDADLSSKKLLEELVQHVVTGFCGMPLEKEQFLDSTP